MSDFKQQYKNPRPGFGHTDHNRILRAYKHVESRREVRTRAFDNNRRLQDVSVPASPFSSKLRASNCLMKHDMLAMRLMRLDN